jgi:hypothetical protein
LVFKPLKSFPSLALTAVAYDNYPNPVPFTVTCCIFVLSDGINGAFFYPRLSSFPDSIIVMFPYPSIGFPSASTGFNFD